MGSTSVEARRACCAVRKVEPLQRALAGATAWITGLRTGQSGERAAVSFTTVDADLALLLVSAADGLTRQTRRHAIIVSPLGVRRFVIAVNKMDLVGWSESRFAELPPADRGSQGLSDVR